MIDDIRQKMREIPAMDALLEKEWVQPWLTELGRETVKRIFNSELNTVRRKILEGDLHDLSEGSLAAVLEAELRVAGQPRLRRVINATGVVIHTNLGRSRLASDAIEAVSRIATGYSNLEYNLEKGERGQRNSHVEEAVCALTGAEAAIVVNNNAGAVLLCLSALARGKEVVVSRGELVEIGGSFRIPDIMEFSGAKLVETGTTNRTHLRDYLQAVSDQTAMFLKVHPSNFRIEGFTAAPERSELAAMAHEHGLIFMEDAGSGLLIDGNELGLEHEADIRSCLAAGVDIITFSGDKMLGGPQIGAIAGKKNVVDALRSNQVLRALRVDKMTLAALEATLRLYMKGDYDQIPTLFMIRRPREDMEKQAEQLVEKLRKVTSAEVSLIEVDDAVGGGSYPAVPLFGYGVAVAHHPMGGAGHLQGLLRARNLPLVCGAREDAVVLHVRTLSASDEDEICKAFAELENS